MFFVLLGKIPPTHLLNYYCVTRKISTSYCGGEKEGNFHTWLEICENVLKRCVNTPIILYKDAPVLEKIGYKLRCSALRAYSVVLAVVSVIVKHSNAKCLPQVDAY